MRFTYEKGNRATDSESAAHQFEAEMILQDQSKNLHEGEKLHAILMPGLIASSRQRLKRNLAVRHEVDLV